MHYTHKQSWHPKLLFQVDVNQEFESRNDVDILLCPSPPVNYTSLLEMGSTYRSVVRRLEGELFANLSVPYGVGAIFAGMNRCLLHSQTMKPTEDLLDRIDAAISVGCVTERADLLAKMQNKTTREFLRHLVIDNSYHLLIKHFKRKDRFRFYYSSETFKGLEYLKWDNLTLFDFLERIAIKPNNIVKIRPKHSDIWSMTEIHTRHAPSCARYRVNLEPGTYYFKATFDIDR